MYSVVLVMALAGSAEAPDCHCGQNKHGCQGVVVSHGCLGSRVGCLGGCLGGRNSCHGGTVVGCMGGVVVVPAGDAKKMPEPEKLKDPKKGKDQVFLPTPA